MHKHFRSAATAQIVALAALLACLQGCKTKNADAASGANSGANTGGRHGQLQMRDVPVTVTPAALQNLPDYVSGLGTVTAYYTVTLKSRVDGQLMSVNFKEGQDVKAGDLLAQIDPRPYQATLAQAEGQLANDQAKLVDGQLELDRYKKLFDAGVVSKEQLDAQQSTFGQYAGAVKSDQANIQTAKLNITYSKITSPINGRVGLRLVDPGNIVHATDTTGLVVITQMEPIAVDFTLPEDALPSVRKNMKGKTLQASAFSRDDQTKLADGTLLTIDNQIDPTTGTAKLKAVFPNKDRALWPDQFVNVRLLLDVQKNQLVIPTAAVQRGPQGTFTYVIKPDNTADVRQIATARSEGALTVVTGGLNAGDSVVVDGQSKLVQGTSVAAHAMKAPAPYSGNAAAAGSDGSNAMVDSGSGGNTDTSSDAGAGTTTPGHAGNGGRGARSPGHAGGSTSTPTANASGSRQ